MQALQMKCQEQRIWLQWPYYCSKDPSLDSKCDEVLNNWLFQELNAECFSRISTTYYFIGVGVSAKPWTTHLHLWLSWKKKGEKWESEAIPFKDEKHGSPSASSKLKCSKVLLHLFALKCKVLVLLLLFRRCYLFMAIRQQIVICLEDLMEIFLAGRKPYCTHT